MPRRGVGGHRLGGVLGSNISGRSPGASHSLLFANEIREQLVDWLTFTIDYGYFQDVSIACPISTKAISSRGHEEPEKIRNSAKADNETLD